MSFKRKPPLDNVRRVRSNGRSIRGTTTGTDSSSQQFESLEERKLALLFQRDPEHTIRRFVSQPLTFEYLDAEGKLHTYVPDYLVERLDGSIEIHEVTLTSRLHREDIIMRADAARRICRERRWKYMLHTEQTLPRGTELANLQALYMYAPQCYRDDMVAEAALRLLDTTRGKPVLLRALAMHLMRTLKLTSACVVPTLCYLIWHSEIEADLQRLLLFINATLSPGAKVWLPQLPSE